MPELVNVVPKDFWDTTEAVCTISFTIEFLGKLVSWTTFKDKTYKQFFTSVLNLIDLAAISPF